VTGGSKEDGSWLSTVSSSLIERWSVRWLFCVLQPTSLVKCDITTRGGGRCSRSTASAMASSSVTDGASRQGGVGARASERSEVAQRGEMVLRFVNGAA
jgi:hypothetical protein